MTHRTLVTLSTAWSHHKTNLSNFNYSTEAEMHIKLSLHKHMGWQSSTKKKLDHDVITFNVILNHPQASSSHRHIVSDMCLSKVQGHRCTLRAAWLTHRGLGVLWWWHQPAESSNSFNGVAQCFTISLRYLFIYNSLEIFLRTFWGESGGSFAKCVCQLLEESHLQFTGSMMGWSQVSLRFMSCRVCLWVHMAKGMKCVWGPSPRAAWHQPSVSSSWGILMWGWPNKKRIE